MAYAFDTPKESQQIRSFKNKWVAAHQFSSTPEGLEEAINSVKILENNSTFSNEMIIVYDVGRFPLGRFPFDVGNAGKVDRRWPFSVGPFSV